jgi:hypothetical protein
MLVSAWKLQRQQQQLVHQQQPMLPLPPPLPLLRLQTCREVAVALGLLVPRLQMAASFRQLTS